MENNRLSPVAVKTDGELDSLSQSESDDLSEQSISFVLAVVLTCMCYKLSESSKCNPSTSLSDWHSQRTLLSSGAGGHPLEVPGPSSTEADSPTFYMEKYLYIGFILLLSSIFILFIPDLQMAPILTVFFKNTDPN